MTADKMPLILDNAMDTMGATMPVDLDDVDLFGDPVGLTLPAHPPSKQLQQRIDELGSRGCCQYV